jgi:tRNA (guanine26-N2/guanine27-N2)-dimethyltransferase
MDVQKAVIIKEGKTEVFVFKKKVTQKGPGCKTNFPFYNPSMELNRDLSILMAQWLVNHSSKPVHMVDGLGASGIRGVRLANEVKGAFDVIINDWDEDAYHLIKKNIAHHKLENAVASNKNLNVLLSENKFHYIDIDPFGSPAYFLDSAMRSIFPNGMVACTATDTAALCGVYPQVCLRRYGSHPFHSHIMQEIGIRILLYVLCREAAKYNKGVEPLVSYFNDHYFRVYVRIRRGVNFADDALKNLSFLDTRHVEVVSLDQDREIGPLWMGRLENQQLIKELRTILFEKKVPTKNKLWKLLDLLEEETDAPAFYYTTDQLASILKQHPPKMKYIFEKLRNKGYNVYRTHFETTGFKTNAPRAEVEAVFTGET